MLINFSVVLWGNPVTQNEQNTNTTKYLGFTSINMTQKLDKLYSTLVVRYSYVWKGCPYKPNSLYDSNNHDRTRYDELSTTQWQNVTYPDEKTSTSNANKKPMYIHNWFNWERKLLDVIFTRTSFWRTFAF